MSSSTGITERKKYLDAAKGWGILMVVFGHITSLGNQLISGLVHINSQYFILFRVIFWRCGRVFARCRPENTSRSMPKVF